MEINIPIKIHNKFVVEVKDIETGEIVKRGYAENIMLNNYFTDTYVLNSGTGQIFNSSIHFGKGTGILVATRTTLFTKLGQKESALVEYVPNTPPTPSYITKKIILNPDEYVGEIITEVGIGRVSTNNTIYTHALIHDSEGNLLELGPKLVTQEITIYATVYATIGLEEGVTLIGGAIDNSILGGLLGASPVGLKSLDSSVAPYIYIGSSLLIATFTQSGAGKVTTGLKKVLVSQANGKVETISIRNTNATLSRSNAVDFNLVTLAQNGSTIWGGHQFLNKLIAVGNGTSKIFTLPWDEAVLTKAKKVYVDGVEKTSGVTWAAGALTFDDAPLDTLNITADYWVDYIPKDTDHEIWITVNINYGEGTPS